MQEAYYALPYPYYYTDSKIGCSQGNIQWNSLHQPVTTAPLQLKDFKFIPTQSNWTAECCTKIMHSKQQRSFSNRIKTYDMAAQLHQSYVLPKKFHSPIPVSRFSPKRKALPLTTATVTDPLCMSRHQRRLFPYCQVSAARFYQNSMSIQDKR